MKNIYKLLIITLLISGVDASELSQAYTKEYTFLKAQKTQLEHRLEEDKLKQAQDINISTIQVDELREKFLSLSKELKDYQLNIEKLTTTLTDKQDTSEITGNVVSQARVALEEYGVVVDESNSTTNIQKLKKAFEDTISLYTKLSSITTSKGKFYLPNGSVVSGDIVKVGNISAYGISSKATGALAPAGDGKYKLWNSIDSSDDAKALFAGEMLDSLDIFVYENLDKEVDYRKEKTLQDTLDGGGTIGYIILVLGAFGLLLLILRIFLLSRSGSNVTNITKIVIDKVENNQGSEALDAIKNFEGSTARVIKATLRNIDRDREHIEDIVTENILNESSTIDRFGNFVLVLAAVAPLLGLLGTVTGMIATFDIITEHGTGDPKLLSGGISEALVTTMFGLIVAIPLLLIGNLLSGWAQNIKDSMEQSALHIVNLYEKHNAR